MAKYPQVQDKARVSVCNNLFKVFACQKIMFTNCRSKAPLIRNVIYLRIVMECIWNIYLTYFSGNTK